VKHIVYKFDDGHSDEMEFDSHGSLMLEEGDIVSRQGASWKVDSIEYQDEGNLKIIPTWWVYLARVLLN
jgi:hypothetical protein